MRTTRFCIRNILLKFTDEVLPHIPNPYTVQLHFGIKEKLHRSYNMQAYYYNMCFLYTKYIICLAGTTPARKKLRCSQYLLVETTKPQTIYKSSVTVAGLPRIYTTSGEYTLVFSQKTNLVANENFQLCSRFTLN